MAESPRQATDANDSAAAFRARCPSCGGWFELALAECACGKSWRADWGGISFRPGADEFYEGRYMNRLGWTVERARRPVGRLVTPFLNFGYWSAILERAPAKARILDLGCAAGSALLGELGTTVGVDLSTSALQMAAEFYPHVVHADLSQLDFPDGQFDVIVSSFLWEHVALDAKDALLARLAAWLSPGGHLVFLFDIESGNPLFRWLRSKPDLYRRSLVDRDGHVGLEPLPAALARFERAGLRLRSAIGLNRTIPHLPVLLWLEPYGRDYPLAGLVAAAGRFLGRFGKLPVAYQFAVHAWDSTIGRLAPADWSRLALVVARRA